MKVCTSELEFIAAVYPAAQKACKRFEKELGQAFYLPSVLIAQAAKENGYGIRSYWDNPGVEALVTYNNMVGIKRDLLNKSWTDIGLYYAMMSIAALSGRFPVPFMGYGASPILGYFIMIWLCHTEDLSL